MIEFILGIAAGVAGTLLIDWHLLRRRLRETIDGAIDVEDVVRAVAKRAGMTDDEVARWLARLR